MGHTSLDKKKKKKRFLLAPKSIIWLVPLGNLAASMQKPETVGFYFLFLVRASEGTLKDPIPKGLLR